MTIKRAAKWQPFVFSTMRLYYHNRNLLEPIESGIHARSLLEAFQRRDHEVLVYPANYDQIPARPSLARRLFQKMPYAIRDRRAVFAAFQQVGSRWVQHRARIAEFAPEAIYLRTNYSDLVSLRVAEEFRFLPLVLEVNALIYQELEQIGRQHLAEFARSIEEPLWHLADAIRVVSGELKAMLIEHGVDPEKINVIYSGADVQAFAAQAHREAERARLKIGEDQILFCYIGSFRYFHGLSEIIDAARQANDPNVRFLMIGDGPRRQEMQRAVAQAGLNEQFHFLGAVPHERIPALLSAADVCLSLYPRGQRMYFCPLKLLEYMAAGKAVLASAIGVQNEILKQNETAYLVGPGTEPLAQAIQDLSRDAQLRETLGMNAALLIREKLTWNHTAEKIEQLFAGIKK